MSLRLATNAPVRMSPLVWTVSRNQAQARRSTGAIGPGICQRESQGVSQTALAPTGVSQCTGTVSQS